MWVRTEELLPKPYEVVIGKTITDMAEIAVPIYITSRNLWVYAGKEYPLEGFEEWMRDEAIARALKISEYAADSIKSVHNSLMIFSEHVINECNKDVTTE